MGFQFRVFAGSQRTRGLRACERCLLWIGFAEIAVTSHPHAFKTERHVTRAADARPPPLRRGSAIDCGCIQRAEDRHATTKSGPHFSASEAKLCRCRPRPNGIETRSAKTARPARVIVPVDLRAKGLIAARRTLATGAFARNTKKPIPSRLDRPIGVGMLDRPMRHDFADDSWPH